MTNITNFSESEYLRRGLDRANQTAFGQAVKPLKQPASQHYSANAFGKGSTASSGKSRKTSIKPNPELADKVQFSGDIQVNSTPHEDPDATDKIANRSEQELSLQLRQQLQHQHKHTPTLGLSAPKLTRS